MDHSATLSYEIGDPSPTYSPSIAADRAICGQRNGSSLFRNKGRARWVAVYWIYPIPFGLDREGLSSLCAILRKGV